MIKISFSLVVCMGLATSAANGAVVFDNGNPISEGAGGSAFLSDFDSGMTGAQSSDVFMLPAASGGVSRVTFYGVYATQATPTESDDFTLRFFADAGGVPSNDPFVSFHVGDVGRTDTGITGFAGSIYSYDAVIPLTMLATGTPLWLSVVNDTAADTDDSWLWTTTGPGSFGFRFAEGEPWGVFPVGNLAFQLSNELESAIPEPMGASLILIGAGALCLRRRSIR